MSPQVEPFNAGSLPNAPGAADAAEADALEQSSEVDAVEPAAPAQVDPLRTEANEADLLEQAMPVPDGGEDEYRTETEIDE